MALSEAIAPRSGKLRQELRRNGFSYLLAVRLMPVVPFWLVNLGGRALRHAAAAVTSSRRLSALCRRHSSRLRSAPGSAAC